MSEEYPKYEVDEPVIYVNGSKAELGIIKRACGGDDYFVNYHTGDTAARTHASHLMKVSNEYAFHITRLDPDGNERKKIVGTTTVDKALERFLLDQCPEVKKELEDYHEIKEMAKHYHFDDLAKDTHRTDTEEKYRLLFNSAICDIQADYRKARAFEIIKKNPQRALLISCYENFDEYIHDKNSYWIEKELMKKDEFDLLKEVLKCQ